jgi:indole-3-glycerol phosphate synthase
MLKPKDYLEKILEKKKAEILDLKSRGVSALNSRVEDLNYSFNSFYDAIATPQLSLISELKKASPSKGLINPNFDIEEISTTYQDKGASAFSVLTEIHYFLGDPSYISRVQQNCKLPVLRKDFIIDPIQVYESRLLGADALLLILDILTTQQAQELLTLATDLNMDVLVEIHSEEALNKLSDLKGLKIVGINNRDLTTFKVDLEHGFKRLEQLKERMPEDVLFVAESGYSDVAELESLEKAGFSAVLIGEGLVTHPIMLDYFSPVL